MVKIVLLTGSNRPNAKSAQVAEKINKIAEQRSDCAITFFDSRNFSYSNEMHTVLDDEMFQAYKKAVTEMDGIIVVSPEYNHSYPGALKMVIDSLYPEYHFKAAGIVGVSKGGWGGTRVIELLIPVLKGVGLQPVLRDLQVPMVNDLFNEAGELQDDSFIEKINAFLDDVIWWSDVIKTGKESVGPRT